MRLLFVLLALPCFAQDELRHKFAAMTRAWAEESILTAAERDAMLRGKQYEDQMWEGLDDPLGRKAMAAGEPSFASVSAFYPGKVLDRTVLGTWSDPAKPAAGDQDEFMFWFNGAISANLIRGRWKGAPSQVLAANTNVVFRVGASGELFGKDGDRYSRVGFEKGYLPILTAAYTHDGLRYTQRAFAVRPAGEQDGWDVAWVHFRIENPGKVKREGAVHGSVELVRGTAKSEEGRVVDEEGAVLLKHSPERFALEPGAGADVYFKIPYRPDKNGRVRAPLAAGYEAALSATRSVWEAILTRGMQLEVPEERVNRVWKALLLTNMVLNDGPIFTYGAGLWYNNSYYPFENGFGAHVFALYGQREYSTALLPEAFRTSITPAAAGRKYQNRRAMPFHHLLENYRLTGSTAAFHRFKEDILRVAEEIIRERRSTMQLVDGRKPWHWGFLPPDKPGVDLRAATETAYVPGHSITNCQGLQDLGEFLVRTGIDPIRGVRYRQEAREFRTDLMNGMRQAAIRLPDRPPFVDLQTLYFRDTAEFGPEPYDHLANGRLQGTYFAYWVQMQFQYNFFNPGDDVAEWLARYLEERGAFVLGNTRARRRPSDEPHYGWLNNVYNQGLFDFRLRGGDVNRFLLGFYGRLAYGMSRHVYSASEGSPFIYYNTKLGGFMSPEYSFPNSAANSETLFLLRQMLLQEDLRNNVETGVIHVMRGVPRAWLEPGKTIRMEMAPTYFGPMSFRVDSSAGGIRMTITPPPRKADLHVHLRMPVKSVRVNGAEHRDFDAATGLIRLNQAEGSLTLQTVSPQ